MAESAAQKAAKLALKQAYAARKKSQQNLNRLESTPQTSVRDSDYDRRMAAKAESAQAGARLQDPYYQAEIADTGKTQAQVDARANALSTVENINKEYSGLGIKSKFDPLTGMITTTRDGVPITNTSPDSPLYGATFAPAAATASGIKDNAAYAALLAAMSGYGIEDLAATLLKIRMDYPDISGEDLLTLLRFDKRYNAGYLKRFAGNAKLFAAGKPTLDEKTYFANEAAYAKIFKAYGVDRFSNREQYATLIGNELAPTEVSTRVSMAYDRILTAGSNVSLALRKYASSLTTGDLIAAMLDPVNQLPALERQITSAEIGGQALNQGLQLSNQARMDELLNAKVDREAALAGYKNIANVIPEAIKFGNIYGESRFVNQATGMAEKLEYNQSTGEEEYLLDNVEAQKKRLYLKAKEVASFEASSGNAPGAFSTSYLKRQSTTGLI